MVNQRSLLNVSADHVYDGEHIILQQVILVVGPSDSSRLIISLSASYWTNGSRFGYSRGLGIIKFGYTQGLSILKLGMVKLGMLKGWVFSNLGMLIFGYTRGWVYSNLGTLKG